MSSAVLDWLHHKVRTVPWFGRLAVYSIPDIHYVIQVPCIGPFRIRLRQNRSFYTSPPLMHEGFMLGALKRAIRPGDVVYDVGANLGLYARFMISRFQAGQVVAFEPSTDNANELRGNLELGRIADQVKVMPMALADADGEENFQLDDVSSASGTLSRVTSGDPSQSRAQYGLPPKVALVRVARLDTIVESGEAPPPQVIKVDAEGAEEFVLRGAANTLRLHRPALVVELHGARVARAVVEYLHSQNYRVFGRFRKEGGEKCDEVYQEIEPRHYPLITGPYSLHHLIAGPDAERLASPILEFDPATV